MAQRLLLLSTLMPINLSSLVEISELAPSVQVARYSRETLETRLPSFSSSFSPRWQRSQGQRVEKGRETVGAIRGTERNDFVFGTDERRRSPTRCALHFDRITTSAAVRDHAGHLSFAPLSIDDKHGRDEI